MPSADRPGDNNGYAIEASKIRETGLKEAIEATLDYYLENMDWM